MEILLKPIGIVRVNLSDEEVRNSWEGVEGIIEVYPEYVEGLKEIDGFSHIIVIAYLHKVTREQRKILKIRHRKLERFGINISDVPEVGVFASDSPHRPNPIALTIVELIKREGNKLYVRNLDLYNNTPVLDLKPYTSDRVINNYCTPWWYQVLEKRIEEKIGRKAPV